MSLNKQFFPILLLLIAAGVATFHSLAQNGDKNSHSVRFKAKDLRERGLSLLTPSDPEFESLVSTRFNEDQLLPVLKPYSVMLQNATNRPLVGYAVRWQLGRADGTVVSATRNYLTLWRLMGVKSEEQDELTVLPHSQILLMPANFSISPNTNRSKARSDEELDNVKRAAAELSEFTDITVTLDGAFFDDGSYIGPDTSNFFVKVRTRLQAKRDLYLEISEGAKPGTNRNEIFKQVENIANGPRIELTNTPTAEELYLKYKQEAAAEMLRIRSASGDINAAEYAALQLRHKWPELRKAP